MGFSLCSLLAACASDPESPGPGVTAGTGGGAAGTVGAGNGGAAAGVDAGGTPSGGAAVQPSAGASTSGAAGSDAGGGGSGGGGPAGAAYSKAITLDTSASGANVPEAVTQYPLAILLDAENFDFTQAQAGGEDLRFQKMDGTPLPHSIEAWDAAAKVAAVWVKVDQIAGNTAGQQIRMLWGGAGPFTGGDSKAVFSKADGFYGVWHLDEDGNTTADGYKDSSEHEAHGTGVNMIPGSRVAGRVGMGMHLDNPDGQNTARWVRVQGEKATAFNPGSAASGPAITVSVWALAYSYPIYSYETIMSKGDTSWSLQRVRYADTGYQSCLLAGGQPGYHFCVYNFQDQPLVTEEWLHFMVVLQQPTMTLYINGRRNASGSGNNWSQGAHPLGIGHQTQFESRRQWDGIIDEARVMQAARSQSWAKLDYESQREDQSLVTYGPAEPAQ